MMAKMIPPILPTALSPSAFEILNISGSSFTGLHGVLGNAPLRQHCFSESSPMAGRCSMLYSQGRSLL